MGSTNRNRSLGAVLKLTATRAKTLATTLATTVTVDQWRAIDADYLDRPLPDRRVLWVLLTTIVSLVLPIYVGSARFIQAQPWAASLFSGLPDATLGPSLYWAGFKLVNYVLVPCVCIRWLLGERIVDHGLRFHRSPKVWLLYLGMLVVVLPVVVVAAQQPSFLAKYPRYAYAGASWWQLGLWEVAYGFQFAALEFFFRGFLLFALARSLGSAAIFVMVVPYTMIHFSKPLAETLGSVLSGVILGTVALRTRSVYGGVLVHCGVAWTMDAVVLGRSGALAALWSGS